MVCCLCFFTITVVANLKGITLNLTLTCPAVKFARCVYFGAFYVSRKTLYHPPTLPCPMMRKSYGVGRGGYGICSLSLSTSKFYSKGKLLAKDCGNYRKRVRHLRKVRKTFHELVWSQTQKKNQHSPFIPGYLNILSQYDHISCIFVTLVIARTEKKKTLGESINLKKQEDWVIGKYKQLDFFSTWLVEEVTPVSWPITERSIVKLDFLWQSNKKIISCTEWLPLIFSNSLCILLVFVTTLKLIF